MTTQSIEILSTKEEADVIRESKFECWRMSGTTEVILARNLITGRIKKNLKALMAFIGQEKIGNKANCEKNIAYVKLVIWCNLKSFFTYICDYNIMKEKCNKAWEHKETDTAAEIYR